MWHPLKRHAPSRVEQFSLFLYLCGSCETLSHNFKFQKVWSFIVPSLFLSHPPQIPPPLLSHFLSSTHQSTTFPSPSLFFLFSTTHTLHFSFPLLILLLLLSFHHSLLYFFPKQGVIKKEILSFAPTRSHQSRISIEVLSFLSFCVIDHPSPKISCS